MFLVLETPWGPVLLVTVPAVYRSLTVWLEGDFGLLSTVSARYFVHFPWATVVVSSSISSVTHTISLSFDLVVGTINGVIVYDILQCSKEELNLRSFHVREES